MDAEGNSSRHRGQVLEKIRNILKLAGIPEQELNKKRDEVYQTKRLEILRLMHVSINVTGDRAIQLIKSGELSKSQPTNIYSILHRKNAEQCFGCTQSETPIYGALNLKSSRGAAPLFSPNIWLQLVSSDIYERITLTARDSYNITLSFLADFEINRGKQALRSEIYTWDTIPEYFLNRFWDIQEVETTSYIEAQIWGGVFMKNIKIFHIKKSFVDEFLKALEIVTSAENFALVKNRIVTYD